MVTQSDISSPNNMITIHHECETCWGSGLLPQTMCSICQNTIPADDEWWLHDNNTLPCGHDKEYLIEQFGCPTCLGTGWVKEEITPQHYRARRFRRIRRGVFLILITAVPTAIFLSIVWQQEGVSCTGWLLSLIPLFWLQP